MTTAREEILARVRRALADVPADELPRDVEVRRAYLREEPGDAVELFVERVADYGTTVVRVAAAGLEAALAERCRARGVTRVAVPRDSGWRVDGVELVPEEELDLDALDGIDGALTGCALAVAATGTIVLDGGPRQGTRRLTLVPDYHLCVVEERQVVSGVPEAFDRLDRARPTTFVSGPSATSDIELSRVEGVHGPRTLDVVLVRN